MSYPNSNIQRPPIKFVIDGRVFTLEDTYQAKYKAEEDKKRLKKHGWLVRIFKMPHGGYALYRRRE